MPQNFLGCDREQVLLMPPNLQEWLSQNHLAWFVLGAVEQMDLAALYADTPPTALMVTAARRTSRR